MENNEYFKTSNGELFSSKEKDILDKIKKFYSSNVKYIEILLDIIEKKSKISIRVLDWFVANYSKKKNIFYKIKINEKDYLFNVNIEYKNQLNGYSKKYFDPFCRKKKIIYCYKNNDEKKNINFISSIGQLNFFQWAIKNKIIVYVEKHLNEIIQDMKETIKKNKEKKNNINNTSSENIFLNNSDMSSDPIICSTENIPCFTISPNKKKVKIIDKNNKKRHQLSKSIYDNGIKKINIPIQLDFE